MHCVLNGHFRKHALLFMSLLIGWKIVFHVQNYDAIKNLYKRAVINVLFPNSSKHSNCQHGYVKAYSRHERATEFDKIV